MAILGSGYVAGVALKPEVAEALGACGQAAFAKVVKVPKTNVAGLTISGNVLKSVSCCQESKRLFLRGFAGTGEPDKGHLKPIAAQLTAAGASSSPQADILEEYCLMVFGLSSLPKGKDEHDIEEAVDRLIHSLYAV